VNASTKVASVRFCVCVGLTLAEPMSMSVQRSAVQMSVVLQLELPMELEVYGALLRPGYTDELEGTLETSMKAWRLSGCWTTLWNVTRRSG
jgi:hypothetical protein